jgi:hypothetical protein
MTDTADALTPASSSPSCLITNGTTTFTSVANRSSNPHQQVYMRKDDDSPCLANVCMTDTADALTPASASPSFSTTNGTMALTSATNQSLNSHQQVYVTEDDDPLYLANVCMTNTADALTPPSSSPSCLITNGMVTFTSVSSPSSKLHQQVYMGKGSDSLYPANGCMTETVDVFASGSPPPSHLMADQMIALGASPSAPLNPHQPTQM